MSAVHPPVPRRPGDEEETVEQVREPPTAHQCERGREFSQGALSLGARRGNRGLNTFPGPGLAPETVRGQANERMMQVAANTASSAGIANTHGPKKDKWNEEGAGVQ
jgi:hypothetical protein